MTTPMERRLASSVVQTEPDEGGTETALHGFHVSPITFHHLPFAPLRLCIKVWAPCIYEFSIKVFVCSLEFDFGVSADLGEGT
jgi:hypothetical protein